MRVRTSVPRVWFCPRSRVRVFAVIVWWLWGVGRGAFVRVAAAVSPEDPTFLSYAFMDGMSCDRTCVNRMLVGKQADRTKRKRGIHQELQLGPAMGMRTAKDLILNLISLSRHCTLSSYPRTYTPPW